MRRTEESGDLEAEDTYARTYSLTDSKIPTGDEYDILGSHVHQ